MSGLEMREREDGELESVRRRGDDEGDEMKGSGSGSGRHVWDSREVETLGVIQIRASLL